jgi:hypothetical protein
MYAAGSSETTRCHIPEERKLQIYRRENLKPQIVREWFKVNQNLIFFFLKTLAVEQLVATLNSLPDRWACAPLLRIIATTRLRQTLSLLV